MPAPHLRHHPAWHAGRGPPKGSSTPRVAKGTVIYVRRKTANPAIGRAASQRSTARGHGSTRSATGPTYSEPAKAESDEHESSRESSREAFVGPFVFGTSTIFAGLFASPRGFEHSSRAPKSSFRRQKRRCRLLNRTCPRHLTPRTLTKRSPKAIAKSRPTTPLTRLWPTRSTGRLGLRTGRRSKRWSRSSARAAPTELAS